MARKQYGAAPSNPLDGIPKSYADSLAAGTAVIADKFAQERVNAFHASIQTDAAAQQLTSILTGAEIQEKWVNLSGWRALGGSSVTSGRLNSNSTVLKKFAIAPGEVGRIATVLRRPSSGLGINMYFGIDVGTDTHAPGTGDLGLAVGLNPTGNFANKTYGSPAVALSDITTYGFTPSGQVDYLCSIDFGPEVVSFCVRSAGGEGSYLAQIDRQAFDTAYGSLGYVNIVIEMSHTSGTGPSATYVTGLKHLQKSRDGAIAAAVDGVTSRRILACPSGSSFSTEKWCIEIPASWDHFNGGPVAIFCHQSVTGQWDEMWQSDEAAKSFPVGNALLNAGYAIAFAQDGSDNTDTNATGDRWGNPTSQQNYYDLYDFFRTHFNTTQVFLLGASMGGGTVMQLVTQRTFPTPAAIVTHAGALSMRKMWNEAMPGDPSGIKTSFKAAWGFSNDADFETATAGYHPEDRQGYEFRGIPARFWQGTSDVVILPDTPDAFVTKMSPFNGDVQEVVVSAGHGGPALYDPTAVVNFFNNYRRSSVRKLSTTAAKILQGNIDVNSALIAGNSLSIVSSAAAIARKGNYQVVTADTTLTIASPVNILVDCSVGSTDITLTPPSVGASGTEFMVRAIGNPTKIVTIPGTFVNPSGNITDLKLFGYGQTIKFVTTGTPGTFRILENSPVSYPKTTHATELDNQPDGAVLLGYDPA